MRGLGDSEKPQTGYDKKTVAEDIYQLIKKLGYDKIYLVAHDLGGPVAYSYAAEHPENVKKWLYLILFYQVLEMKKQQNFHQMDYGIFHFMQ
jgi:pimeloyl-ACP methyl ester carboxylesterase